MRYNDNYKDTKLYEVSYSIVKAENEMLGEANLRLKKQVEELTEALEEIRCTSRTESVDSIRGEL